MIEAPTPSPVQRVVLATANPGKAREFGTLLAELGFEVIPQSELGITPIEETGLSFVENALLKARHASHHSGLPAIADDSGLQVDALAGAPGIHSARYAGPNASDQQNVSKLLRALKTVPDDWRGARFVCLLAFLQRADDATPLICQGTWDGLIAHAPRGTHGFGYDPIFWVPAENRTAAELDPQIKNRLSHRALALSHLLDALRHQSAQRHGKP